MEKNESEYREELKKMSESYAQKEKQLQAESAGMLEKSMQQHEKDKEKLKADHERQLTRAKEVCFYRVLWHGLFQLTFIVIFI